MNEGNASTFKAIKEASLIPCTQLVLMVLWNKRSVGMTATQLCKATGASYGHITMIMKGHAKKRHTVAHHPLRDKRTVKHYLTDSGTQIARNLWELAEQLGSSKASHYHDATVD
jgi:DNA-binding MarR family transcriptional regulator